LAPSENRSNKECGWKEGDRGGSAQTEETTGEEKEERKEEKRRKAKKDLTLTGLLMEGVMRRRGWFSCLSFSPLHVQLPGCCLGQRFLLSSGDESLIL
jgi:hypothetical protein